MAVVYQITSPSGKSYIGVAKYSAAIRFKKHCYDAKNGRKTALAAAIRKHGAEAMIVRTLVESTSEYCFDLESRVIKAYGTLHPHGYNLTTGGEGIHEMAEASKQKHVESHNRPECLAKKSEASKRYNSSPEVRQRKSEEMKKRWKSQAYREKIAKALEDKLRADVAAGLRKPPKKERY